jgi:hypothetical protein
MEWLRGNPEAFDRLVARLRDAGAAPALPAAAEAG